MPADNFFVHPSAVLDAPLRFLQGCQRWEVGNDSKLAPQTLPTRVFIGPHACIGTGASIGEGVVIDAYCRVEPHAVVGANSMILYRGTVGVQANVGEWCVIGGSVSENTIVEDHVTTFGKLIHTHWDSLSSWDFREEAEPSPIIRTRSFIGHDARVIGGVEVGPRAYVCAGATVSRDVPPFHIAFGTNKIQHYREWRGKLRNNPLFQES
ncbi:MAG: DapH/DapD/GlmU-related protein [Pseudomonadota bacterium]